MGLRANVEPLIQDRICDYLVNWILKLDDRFLIITEGHEDASFFEKHLGIACGASVKSESIAQVKSHLNEKARHAKSKVLKIANSPRLAGRRNFACVFDWDLAHFQARPDVSITERAIAIDAASPDQILAIDLESLLVQTGGNLLLTSIGISRKETRDRFIERVRDSAFGVGSFHAAAIRCNLSLPSSVKDSWKPELSWMRLESDDCSPQPHDHRDFARVFLAEFDVERCELDLRAILCKERDWDETRVDNLMRTAAQIRREICVPEMRWQVCRGKDIIQFVELLAIRPNRLEKVWAVEKLIDVIQHADLAQRLVMRQLIALFREFERDAPPTLLSA